MGEFSTLNQPRKEQAMLKTVDFGYADTNESLPKINIEKWQPAKASGIDYKISDRYDVFESSNGKRIGVFETAQSKVCAINYNNKQFVDMQDHTARSEWLISNRGIVRSDAMLTMLASENVLRKEWDSPEEDDAWADL
jgi:hypothetical protein